MSNPKVYVGTWGKYNRGSIAGGWLALNDCKDYQEFLRKCKTLHRGERDPEFMIQDTEDFPDGLSCGDWLSEQDFLDVKQAVSEGDDYLSDDGGQTMAERLRLALLAQMGVATAKVQKPMGDKALLEEYMQEYRKVWGDDQRMLDYCRKEFSSAVRLTNGGILYFNKPRIDSSFCFSDEGPSYDFYCNLMQDRETRLAQYFLDRNLREFDEDIERLQSLRKDCRMLYIQRKSYSCQKGELNLWKWYSWSEWDVENEPYRYTPGSYEKMTDEDRMAILAAMKHEREKFEKRLQAYLKRYGTSKIRTWTYWADA